MGLTSTGSLFGREDVRDTAVHVGLPVALVHNIGGNNNLTQTVYIVPPGKKLLIYFIFSTIKNSVDTTANLNIKNSDGDTLFTIDKNYALNTDFLGGTQGIFGAGTTIEHEYNSGTAGDRSIFSIIGLLIDDE